MKNKFFADQLDMDGHRWGYKDSAFKLNNDRSVTLQGSRYLLCGDKLPSFIPYIEDMLDIKIDFHVKRKEVINKPVTPPQLNDSFVEAVKSHFSEEAYSFSDEDRLIHSHGQTTSEETCRVLYGAINKVVDMVIYIETEDCAQRVVALGAQHNVCLVPFGGGTSVSCALQLPENESRMIVAVDTRRMNKIEWVNEKDRRACVQAGIVGQELEKQLAEKGFMVGHEPDSIEFSTLGGWISTNASGMKKNRYGNIEDIVENITMITPTGQINQLSAMARCSAGMRPHNILFGSEGNLGLITKATIKVHRKPECQEYNSIVFPTWQDGVDFLYALSTTQHVPASIRLVDNVQFRFGQALKPAEAGWKKWISYLKKAFLLNIKGFDPDQMCAATMVLEGSKDEVAAKLKAVKLLAKQHRGMIGGAENGRRGYMLTYAIAYIRDFLSDVHLMGETMETSVAWSDIPRVCSAVERKIEEIHQNHNLPGKPYLTYRIPQIYHTGVCIYFMFGFYLKDFDSPEDTFTAMEHEIRKTVMENGGSISHHHGVGKLRQEFMSQVMSKDSIDLIKSVKKSQDPQNVFGISNNIFASKV